MKGNMTFSNEARQAQIAWKESLEEAARGAGVYRSKPYPFCLPAEYAALNLLPDARSVVDDFALAKIVWHVGVGTGPTNHLCSSQVMCINALAPFRKNADGLRWLFGAAATTPQDARWRRRST